MIYEPAASAVEIRRSCEFLMAPGDTHELRILQRGRKGATAGYFDDIGKLVEAALAWDGKANVYLTLNPSRPELLARACNRLKAGIAMTRDEDIARRRWLLADFDPVRASDISSSSREHNRAITTAMSAWDAARGWAGDPAAIADSGNGCHLVYSLELPNDDASTELVKAQLRQFATFAPDDIHVDQSVFNASRIVRLWGTINCSKGDSTRLRPHRRSRLLEVIG